MTILIYCLIAALAIPYIGKIPIAYAMNQLGGYDNHYPREQQSKLTGFGARALAAHQNGFEALIVFTPAVLLAIATNNISETIQYLAITHVIARIAFHLLYLANIALMRSISWFIAIGCSLAMIILCLP